MSERILKALMQLFAIVAFSDRETDEEDNSRVLVEQFLTLLLSRSLVKEYLQIYDDFYATHHGVKEGKQRKRTSVNSVKVLRICSQINEELTQRQKVIVLIWLLEFIYFDREATAQEIDFLDTVGSSFNISDPEYQKLKDFISSRTGESLNGEDILQMSHILLDEKVQSKFMRIDGLEGVISVLCVRSVNEYVIRYFGKDSLTLNGQSILKGRSYVLSQGSTIRGNKIKAIYHSDVVGIFMSDSVGEKVVFSAKNISYTFPNGNIGLYPLHLQEETGRLVGVMGGSGSGKSTLLNVLNGNYRPSTGSVTLNGNDIHKDPRSVEGQIGYVAQDDLLLEELTVYQNLYYTAKLCFAHMDEAVLVNKVEGTLKDLGLLDKRDLKVGNPLEKTISGGQRKRLNIALELIREPTVLFVDEPTSGLSSRDSENIMDLLKELTLRGKLVFVVIHQPSSDIFKMFDKLFFLDYGGFAAFYGNPIDSIIYFKKEASFANSDEGDCFACGNVNPELIFNILEAKMVDEYGNQTDVRKIKPEEWYEVYKENNSIRESEFTSMSPLPETSFKVPGVLEQFKVFVVRDVLTKLSNRQYMLVNLLEAPALAALLAFFLKFYIVSGTENLGYVFRLNENIPQFIFISVIVALFIGLTVSSEEIIKDRRIRAREAFLNLSRNSYISSKILIMLSISAIQMFLYTLVGVFILEIDGLSLYYWMALFSTCCFANLLGLNISANFSTTKVIYILIPVMIIPQLLFSGVIVSFDKLHPMFASQRAVPWIGNIMASRWGYEGLAVAQFKENDYQKAFYVLDQRRAFANWKKDAWTTALNNKVLSARRNLNDEEKVEDLASDLGLLYSELKKEQDFLKGLELQHLDKLNVADVNLVLLNSVEEHLKKLVLHYRAVFNEAENQREKLIEGMQAEGSDAYTDLLNEHSNESLEKFVTNRNGLRAIIEHEGELIMKKDVIYSIPHAGGLFDMPFYSPEKMVFGVSLGTFLVNMMVLWSMTIFLAFTLYADIFKGIRTQMEGWRHRS
ncbi:MAG: ATP-binding cassette domain-containing protein [Bacteroidetes bacterium]|nr:ATP-binding cassette domain-containing protein [Bacteroidota bacterium]